MDRIAEYFEISFGKKRAYALVPGKLLFEAKGWNASPLAIEYPLAEFRSQPSRMVVPAANRTMGLSLLLVGGICAPILALASKGHSPWDPVVLITALSAPVLMAVAGLLVVLGARTRFTYLVFRSPTGLVFDIGQRGKFKAQFDEFVAKLVAEIEKARREKAQAPPSGA